MSQVHFLHRGVRRYFLGDIPSFPSLFLETFESLTLGGVDFANGWAAGGIVTTYAGEAALENFDTSTLNNNTPPGPDFGWAAGGAVFLTTSIALSASFVDLGGTISATASTSGVSGSALAYQWYQNGVAMTNGGAYSGVTSATMTITGTVGGDYTTYYCVVTSMGTTSVQSNTVTVIDRVSDWSNRVVVNGGAAPAGVTVTALRTFWNGAITDGFSAKISALNALVSDSLIACTTPFIKGSGLDPWTNNNFVLADLSVDGLVGNASNKFLNTGVNASLLSATTSGFAWYAFATTATGFTLGCYDGTKCFMGATKHSDNNSYAYDGASLSNVVTVASSGAGFYSSVRASSTDHRIFFANSGHAHAQIGATDTTSSTASLPNLSMFTHCVSLNGSLQLPTSDRMSFVCAFSGFTSTDSANLFTRTQALRTALGGGFV